MRSVFTKNEQSEILNADSERRITMGEITHILYKPEDINQEARARAIELSRRPDPGRTIHQDEIDESRIKPWPILAILLGAIVSSYMIAYLIQSLLRG